MDEQPTSAPPVLGSQPAPLPKPSPSPSDMRQWNMFCHLAALANLTSIPFAGVLGPLIVWQIKKDEIPSVEQHGKDAINFQITMGIAVLVSGVATFLGFFFCIGFIFLPVLVLAGLASIIFPIIAGVKANSGEAYAYPFSLKFLS